MSTIINDGSVALGSRQLTIAAQVFETDDFNLDFELTRYVRTNGQNVPTGKVIIKGETTGSATLIFPTAATSKPAFGASFTIVEDGVTLNCHVEKVGRKETKAGEAKCPITFSVDIATVVVT